MTFPGMDGQYTISPRMPGELSAQLKAAAEAHERSVSGEIRHVLREHVASASVASAGVERDEDPAPARSETRS
jgi:plasmid stability protein